MRGFPSRLPPGGELLEERGFDSGGLRREQESARSGEEQGFSGALELDDGQIGQTHCKCGQLSRHRVRDGCGAFAGGIGTRDITAAESVRVSMESMGLGAACQEGSSDGRVQLHGCECVGRVDRWNNEAKRRRRRGRERKEKEKEKEEAEETAVHNRSTEPPGNLTSYR